MSIKNRRMKEQKNRSIFSDGTDSLTDWSELSPEDWDKFKETIRKADRFLMG